MHGANDPQALKDWHETHTHTHTRTRTHTHTRAHEFQLNLQIPDGYSQNTVYYSLRQPELLIESFKIVRLFQVDFIGLGTMDIGLQTGSCDPMCKENVAQQVFPETLTQTAYATFKAWFDTTGAANRKWMKIAEDTEPFPGAPPHYCGLMSDGDELPY